MKGEKNYENKCARVLNPQNVSKCNKYSLPNPNIVERTKGLVQHEFFCCCVTAAISGNEDGTQF